MTDSPSDPPSDDPLGSFADRAELLEFLRTTVERLGREGVPPGTTAGGPGWRVDERDDGTYAVVSESTDEVAGAFRDRDRAYLVAATLTAAGPRALASDRSADAVAEPAAGAADLGEDWSADPVERRKEITARTLRGLLANPKALELFLESVDPEVLREAMEIRRAELDEAEDDAN
jgi:hypothetical protein